MTEQQMSVARPNFFLIGAARSGTTALARALGDRAEIFVTEPKEPHFLALHGKEPAFTGPGDDVMINRVAVTDLERYVALYRSAGGASRRGDASVSTLYYAESSVDAIQRHFPEAKLVVILRDPVERAFSAFQYLRSRTFEPLSDFEEALDAEAERRAMGWHHLWHYVAMSRYGEQLQPFVDTFGPERLLVLDHADLAADIGSVVARIDRYLDLGPRQSRQRPEGPANISGEHRSRSGMVLSGALERRPALRRTVRQIVPPRARDALRRRLLRPSAMSSGARTRLLEATADDTARLRRLLGDAAPSFTRRS